MCILFNFSLGFPLQLYKFTGIGRCKLFHRLRNFKYLGGGGGGGGGVVCKQFYDFRNNSDWSKGTASVPPNTDTDIHTVYWKYMIHSILYFSIWFSDHSIFRGILPSQWESCRRCLLAYEMSYWKVLWRPTSEFLDSVVLMFFTVIDLFLKNRCMHTCTHRLYGRNPLLYFLL